MHLVHFHQGSVSSISKVSCERKIIIKKQTNKQKPLNEDETGRSAESVICFNTFQVSNSERTWNIEMHD